MRKRVPKKCNNMIEDMYEGSCNNVKNMYEKQMIWGYEYLGVHQDWSVGPYQFFAVMDEVTKEV